ncbi:MAG: ABC transporter substrate-binding protein [Bacillota bacterium]
MRKRLLGLVYLAAIAVFAWSNLALAQLPAGVPRNETLIVDQIFRYSVPRNFNLWIAGPPSPTRQALIMDTLWYIDQQTGKWINSLAESEPAYNADYTQMTVKLKIGVYWSDGVEFTADDVVFTVKNLMANPGMLWSSELNSYVASVEKADNYTVVFRLKKPYPRFHYLFTARYNAIYMQPKHVWEKVKSPFEYTFWPPVSLGPYVVKDADPAGYWELFERRPDWQRTVPGMLTGQPGPRFILTIFYGPDEKKVIAMAQHNLDVLMDLNFEAFRTLLSRSSTARSWYKEFPWAWPDEVDVRFFGFNFEKLPYFKNRDVRWALALALDIVELQTQYIGGVARVTPIPQPSTPLHMRHYHKPLESWLKELTLELDKGERFKPYDETVPMKIADWARRQGYSVPDEPEAVKALFGIAWWKYAPDIAERLLKRNGFSRDARGKWLLPDGSPWKFSILAAPDEVDVFRLAIGAADQWRRFGIDVSVETQERDPYYTRNSVGDFEVTSAWGFGGGSGATMAPDKWPFIQQLHSRFLQRVGKPAVGAFGGNITRVQSKALDEVIDRLGAAAPGDPTIVELDREFLKLWTENMWTISTISFKKFITFDEYYWTNFPTAENPYGQPNYWFMGSRFVLPYLKPTGRK